MTTNDDAEDAVLDMAIAEALGRGAPPDLWPALAAKQTRRSTAHTWLAAALVLLGAGVVVATALLAHEPDPAGTAQPGRDESDPSGPASLAELLARLSAARNARLQADAAWSTELGRYVKLLRFGSIETMFDASLRRDVDFDDLAAVRDALRGATEGEVVHDVAWTHTLYTSGRDDSAALRVQLRPDTEPRVAFVGPRGTVELVAPSFPPAGLRTQLVEVQQRTIARRGVVIGSDGFAAIPSAATSLRLVGVPAGSVDELARFSALHTIDLCESPAWHDTSVLRRVVRLPLAELFAQPALLAADAYAAIGSCTTLTELGLANPSGDWLEWIFRGGRTATPAPALDDAALLAMRGLRQLASLTLADGSFGDEGLRALAALPLRSIGLVGCTRVGGDALGAFASTSELWMVDCSGLREDFVGAVARMPSLKKLFVVKPGCRVSLVPLRDAKQLTDLHLAARVAADELRLLAEVPTLRDLALLLDPPLRDEDLVWLHGLQQLRRLSLPQGTISDAGRAALKAALPRCTIGHDFW